jgi:SAM-dependent methyltransferase
MLKRVFKQLLAATGMPQQLAEIRTQLAAAQKELRTLPEYLLATDGLPVPPAELRHLVALTESAADFFEVGKMCAAQVRDSLAKAGTSVEQAGAILDFGCGCGRVIRHFPSKDPIGQPRHGTDLNPRLVQWCQENLPFGTFGVNGLEPPLTYDNGAFGLVYSFSVFTHLPEAVGLAWIQELRRILRPGGYLGFSVMDESHLPPDAGMRAQFAAGRLAIREDAKPGENLYGVYHPPTYVRETLARGFEVMEYLPRAVWQSFYLLKKHES